MNPDESDDEEPALEDAAAVNFDAILVRCCEEFSGGVVTGSGEPGVVAQLFSGLLAENPANCLAFCDSIRTAFVEAGEKEGFRTADDFPAGAGGALHEVTLMKVGFLIQGVNERKEKELKSLPADGRLRLYDQCVADLHEAESYLPWVLKCERKGWLSIIRNLRSACEKAAGRLRRQFRTAPGTRR